MGRYILALDQGTTSSRSILFDREGRIAALAQAEIPQSYPEPGWVEHDPAAIWRTQLDTASQVLREADAAPSDIHAIGIANQRETTLLWDRETGEPVHPALVWQDRRTADACEALQSAGHGPRVTALTGLVVDSYFSATKLSWLLRNVPTAAERARAGKLAFGTVDSFLLWKLTSGKVHSTDVTNASRTMLFDIHRMEWSRELLDLFDVPASVLPAVAASSGIVGLCHCSIFGAEIPIAGIAGDQQAATFGQACFQPGMAKCTYGTGAFLLLNTGSRAVSSRNRLLTTVAASPGGFALEGSVFVAGAAIQWLRDELGLIESASEVDEIAAGIQDSGGVYVVPAFVGLGAPYWDPHARGAILGLTRGSSRAHIVRATLESIALQCRDVAEAMALDFGGPLCELRVDGGAASSDVLMQMQADILGVRIVRPKITETTALGAAFLAGLATGFWESVAEVESLWAPERVFEPAIPDRERELAYEGWKRAVERVR